VDILHGEVELVLLKLRSPKQVLSFTVI
jgi:hypothetical protein